MQITAATPQTRTVIEVPAGRITAVRAGGLLRATGIVYAAAGRWELPQPVPPRPIVASRPARACPQLPIPRLHAILPGAFRGLEFDENCLDLSITAPEGAQRLLQLMGERLFRRQSVPGRQAVTENNDLRRHSALLTRRMGQDGHQAAQ